MQNSEFKIEGLCEEKEACREVEALWSDSWMKEKFL
jgi:hypothetical protein